MIINTRFDILNNSYSLKDYELIDLVIRNIKIKFTKNIFLKDLFFNGIDNFYLGNINTMYKLIYNFQYKLDEIIERNKIINGQEYLVYMENKYLFD